MSVTHYRVTDRKTFFDTLGVDEWGLHRRPASPVASAHVILFDRECVELGRFELRYDADGDAAPHQQLLPAADPKEVAGRVTLWL